MELQQDALDEAFRRHKNYFQTFLENEDGYGNYSERVRTMMSQKATRLVVDLNDLREYDGSFMEAGSDNIVTRILQHPMEYIPPFESAVKDLVFNYDSLYNAKEASATQDQNFSIGFTGDFGAHQVSPRTLLSNFLCQVVCVAGIVTKVSAVKPKVVKSVHYCRETNAILTREYRDGTSLTGQPTSSVYPTKDEHGNFLETEFGLSQYKDYQVLTMQEPPETAPLGQLPRSCDVIVENDLVDRCKPGDRIRVIGVYRPLGGRHAAQSSAVFRTVLLANNVQLMGKEVNGIVMTTEDLLNVREFAKRKDCFDILSRSVAPSIFGHAEIKQALLLQLLGGVEKNLDNGTHLRGDINILMVGDPSTAKSQLLRFIRSVAPLAVNTTGRGSSGVGLTAAVTQDPDTKERRLEAGAMVLADRGIVCIDEFDKMSEADRVAIHEVMEQQTVTIAKAGLHATLNARCSVLSAANPVYGQYAKNKKPQENIGLPDSLLSRFDLLFVVLDQLNRSVDRSISDHVLRMHRYVRPGDEGQPLSLQRSAAEEFNVNDKEDTNVFQKHDPRLHGKREEGVVTIDFLKKFVYYAKTRVSPVLTDAAVDLISEGYAELRGQQTLRTLPVTARTLETLIRLASAHAKCRLSKKVEKLDAEKAMSLMGFALYHDTNDKTHVVEEPPVPESAPVSVPEVVMTEERRGKKRKWDEGTLESDVIQVLQTLQQEREEDDRIPLPQIRRKLEDAGQAGVPEDKLEKVLQELEERNRLMYIQDADGPVVMLI